MINIDIKVKGVVVNSNYSVSEDVQTKEIAMALMELETIKKELLELAEPTFEAREGND